MINLIIVIVIVLISLAPIAHAYLNARKVYYNWKAKLVIVLIGGPIVWVVNLTGLVLNIIGKQIDKLEDNNG